LQSHNSWYGCKLRREFPCEDPDVWLSEYSAGCHIVS
jgi:hypothetical protein